MPIGPARMSLMEHLGELRMQPCSCYCVFDCCDHRFLLGNSYGGKLFAASRRRFYA